MITPAVAVYGTVVRSTWPSIRFGSVSPIQQPSFGRDWVNPLLLFPTFQYQKARCIRHKRRESVAVDDR